MSRTLLERREGPFYDPWEALPDGKRLELQRERLRELVSFARERSSFYRGRLEGLPFDARDAHPLGAFPSFTAADLREHIPPAGESLLTDPKATAFTVFQSGGTTGVPKTSLFTHAEMEDINRCNARGFFATGLEATDRVANLWAVGGLYMTFVHMNRMLQEYGCTSFPFSNQTPVEFIRTVARLFDVNVFTGITSVVLNCLRELDRGEPGRFRVEKLYFGGEHIYEADRKEMRERLGVEKIYAPGYGTVDSWYLGYQCTECGNGIFHAFDDQVYLEVLDEVTGQPCASGETGLLHATVLARRLTPVMRFRVGDRARWLGRACPCGRTTPLFELLGRGDDVLRIGYDSIDYAFVQRIASRVPGASGRVRMEKRRLEGRDQLALRIETSAEGSLQPAMTAELGEHFLRERPSFAEFLKKGTVWPLALEWVPEGSLPQNPRTGKLIRIVDSVGGG